jgi:hypothetical protein
MDTTGGSEVQADAKKGQADALITRTMLSPRRENAEVYHNL